MKQLIEVGVLGGLLAAALVTTYFVHFDDTPEAAPAEGVPVYTAAEADLSKIVFDSKAATVTIERRTDAAGEHLWVTATTRTETTPPPPPPPDHTDTDAPPPPAPEPVVTETTKSFLGNDQADKLWASFAPFRAARTLDGVAADLDMGFDAPYATITVERKAGPLKLEIGDTTYGDRSRYVRHADKLYLVEKRELTRLEGSSATLAERRVHPLEPAQIAAIRVARGADSVRFVQRNPDDRAKAYWAREATPDAEDGAAGSWLTTATRLSALEYVAEKPADAETIFSVTFEDRGGKAWPVEVLRDSAEPPTWYLSSAYNRSLVTMTPSQAEDLTLDLDALFAPPASAPAPAPE